ncbi:MAG: metallophosphoesterase [Actinomycetota bacterium]
MAAASVLVLGITTSEARAATADEPVVRAAGDIACDPSSTKFNNGNGTSRACRARYTTELLAGVSAVLGDEQYEHGELESFRSSYALSWGAYGPIAKPAPGNHEYETAGASGYFDYFTGFPRTTRGTSGHGIFSLSTRASASRPGRRSTTGRRAISSSAACTLAYSHEPRFKAGGVPVAKFEPIWQLLYDRGADVVLGGHAHNYQRFLPLDPGGSTDSARGIREFVVGTGGKSHQAVLSDPKVQSSNGRTYRVLGLRLKASGYD